MGWTSYACTRRQMIKDRVMTEYGGPRDEDNEPMYEWDTLRWCVRGSNLYKVVVVRNRKTLEEKDRFIAVDMITSHGSGQMAYKDLTESCGPCAYACPLSYFDLVPMDRYGVPGDREYDHVAAWRDACRREQAMKKEPPKTSWPIGHVFEVGEAHGIRFRGPKPTTKFRYEGKYKRTSQVLLLCLNGSHTNNLGRISAYAFERLAAASEEHSKQHETASSP